jgi:hypothetical protein
MFPRKHFAPRDQVAELRFAAVCPVLEVVPFAVSGAIAAGVTAAAVAGTQSARNRRGNAAGLATDIERVAVLAFDDSDDGAVAGKSARRIECERRPVFELTAVRLIHGSVLLREDGLTPSSTGYLSYPAPETANPTSRTPTGL